jgi:hypothetical protein
MDKVAEIIGVANVEFEGELIAYEADRDGHRVVLLFNDIATYNQYWKVADHVHRCYNKDLVVEHLVPYESDHDPVKRIATQLFAQMREQ